MQPAFPSSALSNGRPLSRTTHHGLHPTTGRSPRDGRFDQKYRSRRHGLTSSARNRTGVTPSSAVMTSRSASGIPAYNTVCQATHERQLELPGSLHILHVCAAQRRPCGPTIDVLKHKRHLRACGASSVEDAEVCTFARMVSRLFRSQEPRKLRWGVWAVAIDEGIILLQAALHVLYI
jgi:hypothetical protein